MTRDDSMLVVDIGRAAATAAAESMTLKCGTLPGDLRLRALQVAMELMAAKAEAMRRVLPGGAEVAAILREKDFANEAELRELVRGCV